MSEQTQLIKKHLIRPFLNKGTSAAPNWVQIKKATEFTRAMNYDLYKKRAIGSEAQKEFLLVNIFDSVTVEESGEDVTYYYAEKTNASVTVEELNATGKSLSCNVYENGTPVKGYVTIADGVPTFTEGDMPSS